VGTDVAEAQVDLAVRPHNEQRRCDHQAGGIAEAFAWLLRVDPQVIVVEAIGGYEVPLVAEPGLAGLPIAGVNPRQVRAFTHAAI
jgi:transposase